MTRYKMKDPELTRRQFINVAMGATATVGVVSLLGTLGGANPVFRLTEDRKPPLEGDILVSADTGEPLRLSDLSESLTAAYPMGVDADGNKIVRSGDPNNLLAVFRFPSGKLGGDTVMEGTIDGEVVAYSDICTHAGCTVIDRGENMFCPCHSGTYDHFNGGVVIGGPPPHKLAQLPLVADGENIRVAGVFLQYPYPFTSKESWDEYIKTVTEG